MVLNHLTTPPSVLILTSCIVVVPNTEMYKVHGQQKRPIIIRTSDGIFQSEIMIIYFRITLNCTFSTNEFL